MEKSINWDYVLEVKYYNYEKIKASLQKFKI